ncbi:adenosine deaminase 2-like [Euwallacea similis]|uniref:adenosine deaminase 2-like n=1 Tax=Euwallacea similis TaxID=1736056 RepID=UPI00344BC60B
MQLFLKILFVYLSMAQSRHLPSPFEDYDKAREKLLLRELGKALGGQLRLSQEEEMANKVLMRLKNEELEEGFREPERFWAGQHFFKAKRHIDGSGVFRLLKKLPKGASLHSHSTALASSDYVFWNITFRENLYGKLNEGENIDLKFFKSPPNAQWRPLTELRRSDSSFDLKLRNQLTIIRNDLIVSDTNAVWKLFQSTFHSIGPLLSYKPVFKDYFYQALTELYEDNVRYLEFRSSVPRLYDLEGVVHDQEETVRIWYETANQFMQDYTGFWGVKLILAPQRLTNSSVIEFYRDFLLRMSEKFPNFIAGFDLVGQEDAGRALKEFIPELSKMGQSTKLFLHAGETLWSGTSTDENLLDAVMLNSSRIGHAYAILKHPEVLRMARDRNIALEICPISNQVLGLVTDLRNHPANHLLANGYPVVITPDDPSFWGAKGLSYDWYVTFMAMASKHGDLRLLKQLAFNSIWFSSMEEELKREALKKWSGEWGEFLREVVKK